MAIADIRLNIETVPPLELQEFYFLRQSTITQFKVGIGCFRLLLSFSLRGFSRLHFIILK